MVDLLILFSFVLLPFLGDVSCFGLFLVFVLSCLVLSGLVLFFCVFCWLVCVFCFLLVYLFACVFGCLFVFVLSRLFVYYCLFFVCL